MNTNLSFKNKKQFGTCFTAMLTVAVLAGRAAADPPLTMAPPIQSSVSQAADDYSGDASRDSVFNWAEVPQNQQVPIRRAVFDQGGYQLYDSAGETIVVPFANQNLYVMKFALSNNGDTYFVNTGDAPVLYLPQGGSLENASVPGARWYPFPRDFHPAQPVFLGIAPSYPEFIDMGWYPDMYAYGGYYGHRAFVSGGIFLPTIGLEFVIGGRSYDGWRPYHHYYDYHPAPYRVTIVNNNIYHASNRRDNNFYGAGHREYAGQSFRGHSFSGHQYRGSGPSFGNSPQFSGQHSAWTHRTFSGVRDFENNQTSHTDTGRSFGGNHAFQGVRSGNTAGHGYDQGQRHFDGTARQNDLQNRPAFSNNSRPAFSGGSSRPSFGGDQPSFSGGDRHRPSSSDSGRHGSSGRGGRSSSRDDGHGSRR